MSPKSKVKDFQNSWLLKYGIKVSARDAQTGSVVAVKCLFCERFGRHPTADDDSRKRKRSSNIQYFKKPWRSDNIVKHMKEQHSQKYEEYIQSTQQQNFFISNDATFQPLNAANQSLHVLIDRVNPEKKPVVVHVLKKRIQNGSVVEEIWR